MRSKTTSKSGPFLGFLWPKLWASARGDLEFKRSENHHFYATLKTTENHQNAVNSVFSCHKPLSRLGALDEKYKMYSPKGWEKAFWPINSVIFTKMGDFLAQMGYFRFCHKRRFAAKTGPKQGSDLENATIPVKCCRTPKFTLARGKIENSHLGRHLLRSARSILDVSAFVFMNEVTDAATQIPLTAVTSNAVACQW